MIGSMRLLQAFRQAGSQGASRATRSMVLQTSPMMRNQTSRRLASSGFSSAQLSKQTSHWRDLLSRPIRRHNSTQPTPPSPKVKYQPPKQPSKSLSERMKEMSKKYGWAVVGIYLGLSALDFPLCFLAVRFFGPERIGHIEHVIVDGVWRAVESVVPSLKEKREKNEAIALAEGKQADVVGVGSAPTTVENSGGKKDSASIWAQLLLAYGVHKSLFFIRIPVTLAITPRVVKTLRGWGWNIGKVTSKTS